MLADLHLISQMKPVPVTYSFRLTKGPGLPTLPELSRTCSANENREMRPGHRAGLNWQREICEKEIPRGKSKCNRLYGLPHGIR